MSPFRSLLVVMAGPVLAGFALIVAMCEGALLQRELQLEQVAGSGYHAAGVCLVRYARAVCACGRCCWSNNPQRDFLTAFMTNCRLHFTDG
jgi:hypothetical protein